MNRVSTSTRAAPKRVRILLVDDHPMIRERLAEIINREHDLTVCGEAGDRHEALAAISTAKPDLLLLDLKLRSSHGLDLIKDVRANWPTLLMLVLSMHDESLYAERVIQAGARGYITKQEATRNILVAIRRVLAGEIYLNEKFAARIIGRLAPGNARSTLPSDLLADRELQVFELIGRGLGNRQIAASLHIDVKTVETYRTRIKLKLAFEDANALRQAAIQWNQVR